MEAVVALVARTRGLKAILLEDGSNEGAGVCSEEYIRKNVKTIYVHICIYLV